MVEFVKPMPGLGVGQKLSKSTTNYGAAHLELTSMNQSSELHRSELMSYSHHLKRKADLGLLISGTFVVSTFFGVEPRLMQSNTLTYFEIPDFAAKPQVATSRLQFKPF